MGVLKGICYLVAAIAVLTAIFVGIGFIVFLGIVLGLALNIGSLAVFTANGMKSLFENRSR